jgi:protein-disulfide isomerase
LDNRILYAAGAFVAVILVGGIIASRFSSGEAPTDETYADSELAKEMAGDHAIGAVDAPITVIEYASMTCSHCADFHGATFPDLKENYIDTGKVRFIFREYPLDPAATTAFLAARCSAPEKYFDTVKLLFSDQAKWIQFRNADELHSGLAKTMRKAGVTRSQFDECRQDQQKLDSVRKVKAAADATFGNMSTPSFFINGQKHDGALPFERFEAILSPMLQSNSSAELTTE